MGEIFKKKNSFEEGENPDAKKEQGKKMTDFDEQVQKIQLSWEKDIEAMKKIIPDFDFAKAMENEEFYALVMKGNSIPLAYLAVTMKEKKSAPQRKVITQNAQSASAQNGALDQSVENMSDEDFAKYIKRIKGM